MKRIEELREQYYKAIKLLQNKEEIIDSLPKPEYKNFFPLIDGLIELLKSELDKTKKMLKESSMEDETTKKYIEEEINIIKFKINACIELKEEATEIIKEEQEVDNSIEKNIIFATTENGNICFENDLKNIPEEYYIYIEKMLKKLQEGFTEGNTAEGRQQTNNPKLKNVHKIKEFKVRVVYKILSSDTVYVMMALMKKNDNNALERKMVINRTNQTNIEYKRIKEIIKDPNRKEELIYEHKKYLNKILGKVRENKR